MDFKRVYFFNSTKHDFAYLPKYIFSILQGAQNEGTKPS